MILSFEVRASIRSPACEEFFIARNRNDGELELGWRSVERAGHRHHRHKRVTTTEMIAQMLNA